MTTITNVSNYNSIYRNNLLEQTEPVTVTCDCGSPIIRDIQSQLDALRDGLEGIAHIIHRLEPTDLHVDMVRRSIGEPLDIDSSDELEPTHDM